MMRFIREEGSVPLQYSLESEPIQWSIRPDEPVIRVSDLHELGCRIIDQCLNLAGDRGKMIQSLDFIFSGNSFNFEASIKPSSPTCNRKRLSRLLELRLEYLKFENPVHEISCCGLLSDINAPQSDLFGADFHRYRHNAMKVLSSIQSERGPDTVQFAQVIKTTLPTRQYRLRTWNGFPEHSKDRREENVSQIRRHMSLVRRIAITPRAMTGNLKTSSDVEYSGAWWDEPYHYGMAFNRVRGKWQWLQKQQDQSWELVGWVD